MSSAAGLARLQLGIDEAIDYAICKHFTRMRHSTRSRGTEDEIEKCELDVMIRRLLLFVIFGEV